MRDLNAAAIAQVGAEWTPERVHQLGDVPDQPATPYLIVSVTTGAPKNYRLSAQQGSKGYRIVVQAIGRAYDEVAGAVEKADAAFEDRALTVAGLDCTPCAGDERVSSPVIRDPDGGGFLSCTVLYPFIAYPTE